jgi:hypothetical protein
VEESRQDAVEAQLKAAAGVTRPHQYEKDHLSLMKGRRMRRMAAALSLTRSKGREGKE